MKEYVLVDSECEMKRYLSGVKHRARVVIDPDIDDKVEKLKSFFFTDSIFEDPLVVLKWIEKWNKREMEWLKSSISKCEKDVIVFSANETLIKYFGKPRNLLQPKPWQEDMWNEKIKEISLYKGVKMGVEAISELLKRTGPNLDIVCMELEKLRTISKSVSKEMIEEYVPFYTSTEMFDFVHRFFEKKEDAVYMLKDILKDWHFLSVVKALENQCLVVLQLLSLGKEDYSWKEIQETAKMLEVRTSVIAEVVGFPLGGKKRRNLLKSLSFEKVADLLEKVQDMEFRYKHGERQEHVFWKVMVDWLKS